MWVLVLAGAATLTWFLWWRRRPHHHRTGGDHALTPTGRPYSRLGREFRSDDPPPHQHAAPGEYDGD
jgi:hypothetical protein